jgi:hypothetical protein
LGRIRCRQQHTGTRRRSHSGPRRASPRASAVRRACQRPGLRLQSGCHAALHRYSCPGPDAGRRRATLPFVASNPAGTSWLAVHASRAPARRAWRLGVIRTMSISEVAKSNARKWMPAGPASENAIASLVRDLGFDLPADYLEFLRFSNGGCGDIPVQPWCFDSLWTAEELIGCNRDYEVARYCPGFFGIGSSGGGEMFAFDMRGPQPWPVVVVPFIGMETDSALLVAPDLRSFVSMFGRKGIHATS